MDLFVVEVVVELNEGRPIWPVLEEIRENCRAILNLLCGRSNRS